MIIIRIIMITKTIIIVLVIAIMTMMIKIILIIVMVTIIINSLFQPGDFSAGSTTAKVNTLNIFHTPLLTFNK